MDGVLWLGETPLPGLERLFRVLGELGLPFVLATNSAARTPAECSAKLARFGVSADEDSIVTSAVCAAAELREAGASGPVYVVGEAALREAVAGAGFALAGDTETGVDAVVVGLDRSFTYEKLAVAARLVRTGALFLATNCDNAFPVESGLSPGAGAIVAAVATAAGRDPRVVGKPEPAMFEWASHRLGVQSGEILVVGDRLDTDIRGAANAGMRSALVATGVDKDASGAESGARPDLVFGGLEEMADWLLLEVLRVEAAAV
jgi:4-nitrophenyl phosphatase